MGTPFSGAGRGGLVPDPEDNAVGNHSCKRTSKGTTVGKGHDPHYFSQNNFGRAARKLCWKFWRLMFVPFTWYPYLSFNFDHGRLEEQEWTLMKENLV